MQLLSDNLNIDVVSLENICFSLGIKVFDQSSLVQAYDKKGIIHENVEKEICNKCCCGRYFKINDGLTGSQRTKCCTKVCYHCNAYDSCFYTHHKMVNDLRTLPPIEDSTKASSTDDEILNPNNSPTSSTDYENLDIFPTDEQIFEDFYKLFGRSEAEKTQLMDSLIRYNI